MPEHYRGIPQHYRGIPQHYRGIIWELENSIIGKNFSIIYKSLVTSIPPTQSGVTPLQIAQQHEHSDVVSTLITYGADTIDLAITV